MNWFGYKVALGVLLLLSIAPALLFKLYVIVTGDDVTPMWLILNFWGFVQVAVWVSLAILVIAGLVTRVAHWLRREDGDTTNGPQILTSGAAKTRDLANPYATPEDELLPDNSKMES